jgi:hypothetical protein
MNVTANLQLPMKKWTLEDDSDEEEDKQDNKENKDEIIEEEVDPLDAFMQVTCVLHCSLTRHYNAHFDFRN